MINGRAAPPMTVSSSPCGQSGAGISSAETNCEETAASTRAAPPLTPPSPISITTGGHPLSRSARTEMPSAANVSSSGPIGRSRIRWFPSSRKRPRPSVRKPSRKRIAVPAPPASKSPPRAGIAPPHPSTTIRAAVSSTASAKPSVPSAAAIRRVSSFRPTPEIVESPFAIAASNSTRLVMLLEPGTLMDAASGRRGGTISISST